jgi:hypothetical protein
MCRCVLEAGDLLILSREVHNRVEHQIGHREVSLDGGRREVADGDTDLVGTRFRSEPRHHRLGKIDAMHANASLRQR